LLAGIEKNQQAITNFAAFASALKERYGQLGEQVDQLREETKKELNDAQARVDENMRAVDQIATKGQ
jgi:hypothetical protein